MTNENRERSIEEIWADTRAKGETWGSVTITEGYAVGIKANDVEAVMAIAVELVANENAAPNTPFSAEVEGEAFTVYANGAWHNKEAR